MSLDETENDGGAEASARGGQAPTHGREPATVRVAMWSARHRWPVALLWFVATIGVFAASLSMGGINAADANQNPNERKLEASEAYDLFNAGGTADPYEQFLVVIDGGPGATTNPAFKASVDGLVAPAARRQRAAERGGDPDLRPVPQPVRGAAAGGPRVRGRDDGPGRRPHLR